MILNLIHSELPGYQHRMIGSIGLLLAPGVGVEIQFGRGIVAQHHFVKQRCPVNVLTDFDSNVKNLPALNSMGYMRLSCSLTLQSLQFIHINH